MGRRLRTRIPQLPEQLQLTWSYMEEFRRQNEKFKARQKRNFDKRHRVRESDAIPNDSPVWITSEGGQAPGTVVSPASSPRSYIVKTPSGTIRRNRIHLNVDPLQPSTPPTETKQNTDTQATRRIATRSQTGTTVKPPERLYA